MKTPSNRIWIHLIGALSFLALPILFSPDIGEGTRLFRITPFRRDFIGYFLVLLFFYLSYFFLLPKYYFTKKYKTLWLLVLMSLVLVCLVPALVVPYSHGRFPHAPPGSPKKFYLLQMGHHIFVFGVVFFFSLVLKINEKLKQTEKEKLSNQLSYLKAQINPHFLFNTLNSIYSLALVKSDLTADAVVKLSSMMRYVTTEASTDLVPLTKEIDYLNNYIRLQKMRLGDTADVSYEVSGDGAGKQIAPLILIPFIENAFKHGVNPEENSRIGITLQVAGTELRLQVQNQKVHVETPEEPESGIGLENVRQRLELLYPARYLLHMDDQPGSFSVSLTLVLT